MDRSVPAAERRVRQLLAANVRRLRNERRLVVIDAAERADMHWRLWQKVEAADTNATLQTLTRLAACLGVDVKKLFE